MMAPHARAEALLRRIQPIVARGGVFTEWRAELVAVLQDEIEATIRDAFEGFEHPTRNAVGYRCAHREQVSVGLGQRQEFICRACGEPVELFLAGWRRSHRDSSSELRKRLERHAERVSAVGGPRVSSVEVFNTLLAQALDHDASPEVADVLALIEGIVSRALDATERTLNEVEGP